MTPISLDNLRNLYQNCIRKKPAFEIVKRLNKNYPDLVMYTLNDEGKEWMDYAGFCESQADKHRPREMNPTIAIDSREQHPYVFEGPTEVKEGYSQAIRETFTCRDIRFTRKPNTLYAFFLDWPEEGEPLIIQSLSNKHHPKVISHISLLGHEGDLAWERSDQGLRVQLPPQPPGAFAYTLKITSTHGHIRAINGI